MFTVKPHLTREEFLHTEFLVNEFASGIGKELQRKLEIRAKSMRNWVTINGFVYLSITLWCTGFILLVHAGVTKDIRIRCVLPLVRGPRPLVTPVHFLSKYKREFKLQVYGKWQTSDSS